MSSTQPPRLIADIYRDLRDRRLLVPVVVLLAALFAVPLVLARSPEAQPPPAPAGEPEATAAAPAVLAEDPGIRNYRKRLEALNEHDPFDQKFTLPEPGSAEITELEAGSSAPPADLGSAPTHSPDLDAPSPNPAPASAPPSSSEPSTPSNGSSRRPTRLWYTWEADLVFGRTGEPKRHDDVGALDLLPRAKPVVAMLGAGPVGRRATFMMPDDLASIDGGGCQPSKARCFFLRLGPGEQRRFTVEPDGGDAVAYRLKVLRISERIVKRTRK